MKTSSRHAYSVNHFLWLCLILLSVLQQPCLATTKEDIPVIPRPQSIIFHSGTFTAESPTLWFTNLKGKDLDMLKSYLSTLPYGLQLTEKKQTESGINLIVDKHFHFETLKGNSQEGYSLEVTPHKVNIKAATSAGLFYGLQTLLQLSGGVLNNRLSAPCCVVEDAPRFPYRGIMLDVSRHFFPKSYILKTLDALAYFKINIFHWHLADSGGWRLYIDQYPKLTQLTAWRPYADLNDWWNNSRNAFCTQDTPGAYGGFYTKEEIREIVRYAQARHITIIPEIDMPGHSRDVLWSYPELCCPSNASPKTSDELCIGNEATFNFCEKVLDEVMALFPSKYIHIGGDECNRSAWEKCPLCQKRMRYNNIKKVADLQGYFTTRIGKYLARHGRTLIGWDELLDGDCPQDAVIMSWREEVDGRGAALARGHRLIASPTSHCYLDYYQDCPYYEPEGILGYTPLEKTYSFEPLPADCKETSLVLGLQGNLWTEHVPNESHADYMLYPRTLAIAEVGWTQPELKNYANFRARAVDMLAKMESRGYNHFNLLTEAGPRKAALEPIKTLAAGCKVEYRAPYDSTFAGSGSTTLTDTWLGNWNGNGDRWQGFVGNMDVVIDLGKPTVVRSVKASFLFVPTGGQYLPDSVEVSLSDDNSHFTTVYNHKITSDYTYLYDIKTYGWNGFATTRYIRYHATKPINWGDLLCDEIVVK